MASHKKLSTKSSETIVSDDLLSEIFLRLPSRSIQRFITTNKRWQSLLTNPTFRKLWRKRNLKPSTGLFIRSKVPTSTNFLPLSSNNPTTNAFEDKIKQSCNGLLLCSIGINYYVYNPTTNVSFTLPCNNHIVSPGTKIRFMSLAFDPNSLHYKVVCCIQHPFRLHVYSSQTRAWKPVSKLLCQYRSLVNDKGVYWNGAIHWMYPLSYFDIENESFKRLPKPPYCGNWRTHYYVGESCDRLNYVKLLDNGSGNSCIVHVYELKRDYSGWVLKHHVYLDYRFNYTSVISVVHGIEEDGSFMVLKTRFGIVRYNLVSKTSEELPFAGKGEYIDRAFQYIESQCSVLLDVQVL